MTTDSFAPRYFSFFLMIFVFAQNGVIYAWIANAVPRPPAKRAAALAFVNSFGNAASIWTPFTYYEAPHYRAGLGAAIGLQCLAFVCAVALRWVLRRQNRQLAALAAHDAEGDAAPLTDAQVARLRRTAELEGTDVATARRQARAYRYMI